MTETERRGETPIIPGFHPDPSICRAGDDYCLVTSSFEYLPGVPVFHSTDLLHWRQLGNVLERDDQLTLPGSTGGRGIYAPTIRHHGGRFWMTTTNIDRVREGHLIVSATDPAGPWSTPVYVDGTLGIDPDLFWDDDGTCYLTWTGFADGMGILQAAVDPVAGVLLEKPRRVWQGTGLAVPEGPHVYRRGDWYYLMLAEGGTERGHAVTVARSRSLAGPYEAAPGNPILSHRSTGHPVQNTGHADLVEGPDGRWAMVYLGVRAVGPTPSFHLNGRETFLAGIDWIDDWPVVDENAFEPPAWNGAIDDRFASFGEGELDVRWVSPGRDPRSFTAPAWGGGIAIDPSDTHRPLLAVRTEFQAWEARATVDRDAARLVVRIDDAHWAAVESVDGMIRARLVIGPVDQVLASTEASAATSSEPLVLAIRSTPEAMNLYAPATMSDQLELGYHDGEAFVALARFDGRYISTEVAGGFTGRVVGVEPTGRQSAILRRFEYQSL